LPWACRYIVDEVKSLAGRGVQFECYQVWSTDELGVWSAPGGARIAWFKDPDGNALSLTQF
jgi:hypothetical protein